MKKSIFGISILLILLLLSGPNVARAENGGRSIEISELMASNRCTLQAEDGSFPDWVELYNPSSEEVSLEGIKLADRRKGNNVQAFPDIRIPPQGRIVVFADGMESSSTELHLPFKISEEENLFLLSADGEILDELSSAGVEKDASICKENGVTRMSNYPTPGFENTMEGFNCLMILSASPKPFSTLNGSVKFFRAKYLRIFPVDMP